MAAGSVNRGKCVKCGTVFGARSGDENDSWRIVGKAGHLSPLSTDATIVRRRNRARGIAAQNRMVA